MSAANGVLCLLDVLVETLSIVALNQVETSPVKFLDALPDLSLLFVVVGEIKSLTPVAEVARNNK